MKRLLQASRWILFFRLHPLLRIPVPLFAPSPLNWIRASWEFWWDTLLVCLQQPDLVRLERSCECFCFCWRISREAAVAAWGSPRRRQKEESAVWCAHRYWTSLWPTIICNLHGVHFLKGCWAGRQHLKEQQPIKILSSFFVGETKRFTEEEVSFTLASRLSAASKFRYICADVRPRMFSSCSQDYKPVVTWDFVFLLLCLWNV